jgi:hypothetical protein
MPVISGSSIVPLAKIEQKNSLLVTSVLATCRAFGGMPDTPIIYFDRSNPQTLFGIVDHIRGMMLREGSSALVHVEGIRSQTCRKPVQTVSGVILDLALSANVPIVPVRFVGGLPIETAPARLDFPIGFGKQTYMLGDPISPEVLAKLPLVDRKELVLSAINQLGPRFEEETPAVPNPQFAARVAERANSQGISETEAVLLECAELPYEARIADLIALTNLQGPSQTTAGEK